MGLSDTELSSLSKEGSSTLQSFRFLFAEAEKREVSNFRMGEDMYQVLSLKTAGI